MKKIDVLKITITALLLTCCAKKEDVAVAIVPSTIVYAYNSGQAAAVVIGQADFTTAVAATTQSGINTSHSNAITTDGRLYLATPGDRRILGFNTIPTTNGVNVDLVVGQANFTNAGVGSLANELNNSDGVAATTAQLFISDTLNHRVLIYNTITAPTGTTAAFAIGQTATNLATNPDTACGGFLGCGATSTKIRGPSAISVGGGKLAIASSYYHRVLLYNSIPNANNVAADIVLGQPNFTSFASGAGASALNNPKGVWTNGTKVVVSDGNNHRILIWNTWPTISGQAPDIVLGQPSGSSNTGYNNCFCTTPTSSSLFQPSGIGSNGTELAVVDSTNSRVLIWSTWPTANHQAANIVLGQANFITTTAGTTNSTFNSPIGLSVGASSIYVNDYGNNRLLIFNKLAQP